MLDHLTKIHLIRNATLRITYAGMTFLLDPMLSDKLALESFVGKSRNPTVDLPIPISDILRDIDAVIISHMHADHFDSVAQKVIPDDMQLFCQPSDVPALGAVGFVNILPVDPSVLWNGISITRISGRHGTGKCMIRMGEVSGFIFKALHSPTILWAGDTIWCESIMAAIKQHNPDIIITHSCGASIADNAPIIMDEKQTVSVCKAAPHATVIAVHMEAVDHARVTRAALRTYAGKENVADEQLLIPDDGDILTFVDQETTGRPPSNQQK